MTRQQLTIKLKRLIWEAGGVKEFAKKVKVSVYTAENWYCGRTVPTGGPTICKLVRATGLPVEEFFMEKTP